MLSPNQAFILFDEQSFTVYRLVFNLNFVQSADLSAFNKAGIKEIQQFSLHYRPDLIFSAIIYASQHNTMINHSHRIPSFASLQMCGQANISDIQLRYQVFSVEFKLSGHQMYD